MKKLEPIIHDDKNGLDYILVGDYYIPDLKLPKEHRLEFMRKYSIADADEDMNKKKEQTK